MKNTGIVRKVDELGRIVIPKELRNQLNINIKDSLEIYVAGSDIILKKFQSNCSICGKNKNLATINNKLICASCIELISKLKV